MMSIPRRLWRIAQGYVKNSGLGGIPGYLSDAERELEEFLGRRRPPTTDHRPPSEGATNGAGPGARSQEPGAEEFHPLARHYRTLGIPAGSDLETVEKAWRRLVLENHPDRFMHDAELQKAASDRLREINAAHEALEAYLAKSRH
jgi:DnaJ-domain-containing protein 1